MHNIPSSRKRLLIDRCKRLDVGIYIDDPSENSTGVYSELRGVASEAELERRLNAKRSVSIANRAGVVSLVALVVSVAALVVPYFKR